MDKGHPVTPTEQRVGETSEQSLSRRPPKEGVLHTSPLLAWGVCPGGGEGAETLLKVTVRTVRTGVMQEGLLLPMTPST